ncbi:hypothetical protein VCHA37P200_40444 [Vibrio chagasii]|nr:hypothetical protein VCHA53O468_30067 [Vibrio chagasii]CAH7312251.1 hypothetical protein VCHA55O507_40444 [Vibrio chagasii]CAH7430785.1 hypothetical protein VCHA37P200_40444 [Vibrio chagasii]CAH7445733.1 hypothetical protein VCHA43P274_40069 [Vibrio chagasii]
MLEVTEPVRKALKQNAHYAQESLYHGWSVKNSANIKKALAINITKFSLVKSLLVFP